jgi:hypothetical protein
MKESYRKGVASRPGPESCVASGEAAIEALTGGSAGRVLSCEIIATGVPTLFSIAEGHRTARQSSDNVTACPMPRWRKRAPLAARSAKAAWAKCGRGAIRG